MGIKPVNWFPLIHIYVVYIYIYINVSQLLSGIYSSYLFLANICGTCRMWSGYGFVFLLRVPVHLLFISFKLPCG